MITSIKATDGLFYTSRMKKKRITSFRNRQAPGSSLESAWILPTQSRRTMHTHLNFGTFHYDVFVVIICILAWSLEKLDIFCLYCSTFIVKSVALVKSEFARVTFTTRTNINLGIWWHKPSKTCLGKHMYKYNSCFQMTTNICSRIACQQSKCYG